MALGIAGVVTVSHDLAQSQGGVPLGQEPKSPSRFIPGKQVCAFW